jgi:tetratricopeptide (TPR) repeat protein
MNFLKNIFGKKNKQQESTTTNQPQEEKINPDIEEPADSHLTSVVSKPDIPPDDETVKKPVNAKPAEPNTNSQEKLKPEPGPDSTAKAPSIPWRTFPIFISSTFADMQAERDHLKNVVFPKVEEELQKRRIKLEIVDLRWGVDTTSMEQEDEREASVLKVCLDEIRRCRPFFIGLLGDRYGWVPPLGRMKTALVGETHLNPEKGKSVTDLEIEFGVLASQEQLVRSVFYFREPLPYDTFGKKKAAMFSDEYNPDLSEAEKKERKTSLENLKTNIRDHFEKKGLKDKVKMYSGTWDVEKEKLTGLKPWGDQVYADILAECESHAKDTWDKVPQNWQEQEMALLDAFIENNTSSFCGRKPLLETLKQHLLSGDTANWGLILTGESGSGKSAVFSMVNKMMQKENCFILAHSAGLSARAKKVADLLQIWNRQLADYLGIKEELSDATKIADDLTSHLTEEQGKAPITPTEKLQEKFLELLHRTSASKRVLLLIDALDRFEPTARAQHLSWLPSLMPQNVRLLCTAITGTEQKAANYHKGLLAKSIDIFSTAEAKEMLDALCLRQHKSLPAKIEKIILEKKRANGQPVTSSPLWLSLAVNMLMAIDHDDFEKMSQLEGRSDQQIESYMVAMANDFDSLPGPLFLSLKNKASLLFGETFTTAVFNYLAISRNGLREKDLEKLMPASKIDWDPLQFANLRRWFKAHLVIQGEELQWNLGHSILRNTLQENLPPEKYTSINFGIATHLLTLPGTDSLRASETMFHLLESEKLVDAAAYYGSNLTKSEISGATVVMAETITGSEKGIGKAVQLPYLLLNQFEQLNGILKNYIYELNDELSTEGNLMQRQILLAHLFNTLQDGIEIKKRDNDFGYYYAVLSEKLGSIHQSMGHLEEALKYFEKRSLLGKELFEANPSKEEMKHGLAISYQYLGRIHQSMGHLEEALKFFENSNQLSKELYEANFHNEGLKHSLVISYQNLGHIHQSMGHLEEALKYFGYYNQFSKELYEANPHSEKLKNSLAISYSRLGYIHKLMNHMEEAFKYFGNYNQFSKELYEANPRSEKLKYSLSISYEKLGSIHQSMGHVETALKYFENFNQFSKELCEANPRSEEMKNGLAISNEKLGDIHQSMDHIEEALNYFELSCQLSKELYEANPHSETLKNKLSKSYSKLGNIHDLMNHMDEALKYYGNYNQFSKELYEANPRSEKLKNNLAISYENLGSIHQSMGHIEEALKYFENYNRLEKELHEANPHSEMLKNNLAISYEKLGSIHQSMGHVEVALNYFENYNKLSKELCKANLRSELLKYSLAISYEKLGSIHRSMGHIEEALKYFENYNQLGKELYEANPCNESLKDHLAISFEELGSIHQSMGHMEEAVKYFEHYNRLGKELYEANLRNLNLLERLGVSYYKLAMLYKAVGNNTIGKERFAEWKKIISFLATNVPQVDRYRDWDKVEY